MFTKSRHTRPGLAPANLTKPNHQILMICFFGITRASSVLPVPGILSQAEVSKATGFNKRDAMHCRVTEFKFQLF